MRITSLLIMLILVGCTSSTTPPKNDPDREGIRSVVNSTLQEKDRRGTYMCIINYGIDSDDDPKRAVEVKLKRLDISIDGIRAEVDGRTVLILANGSEAKPWQFTASLRKFDSGWKLEYFRWE